MTASTGTKAAAQALLGLNLAAPRAARTFVDRVQKSLSEEQEGILSKSDHRMVITALAGSGKSKVLSEFARRDNSKKWHYLAFNKSMASEASASMPGVNSRTIHSLAFSAFGRPYATKVDIPWDVTAIPAMCGAPNGTKELGLLILGTVSRFIASSDQNIHQAHIPVTPWKKWQAKSGASASDAKFVVDWAYRLWSAMVDTSAPIQMDLDGIVKLMQLASFVPQVSKNAVFLVDEAQDLTPCIRDWVNRLPYRVIRAGDPFQSIYGWRMQGLSSPWVAHEEVESWLCGSWRFGGEVAKLVGPVLDFLGCQEKLVGMGGSTIVSTEELSEDVLIARTRRGVVNAAIQEANKGRSIDLSSSRWLLDFIAHQQVLDLDAVEDGDEWTTLAALNGDRLMAALSPDGVKIMTAHASKGASFEAVRLSDDFSWPPVQGQGSPREEARVLYVALTRARSRLSLPSILLESLESAQNSSLLHQLQISDDGF